MGYDLHIHRGDEWARADDQRGRITLVEWRRLAEADPEFTRAEDIGSYLWTRSDWTFQYRPGRIKVKSPDDQTVRKMIQIACELKARVQGDEGEFYRLSPQAESGYESYRDEPEGTG